MQEVKGIGCDDVLFALQENHIRTLTGALLLGAGSPRITVLGHMP